MNGELLLESLRRDWRRDFGESAPLCRWCRVPLVRTTPGVAAIACDRHQGEADAYRAEIATRRAA